MVGIGVGLLLAQAVGCSADNPAYAAGGDESAKASSSTGTNHRPTDSGASAAGESDTMGQGGGSSPTDPTPTNDTTGSSGNNPGESTETGKDTDPSTGLATTGGFDSSGETGSNPVSSCCISSPDGSSGCADNPKIEACVCAADNFCCDAQWDQTCVAQAIGCGLFCPQPALCCYLDAEETCFESAPGQCVCAMDPSCCDDDWTLACAQLAATSCEAPCPSGSDCCANGSGPGCDVFEIQACVCGADPFCCNANWDSACVASAVTCGAACDPPTGGDCCISDSGLAGCTDPQPSPGTQNCVCQTLPQCCSADWTLECVNEAIAECGLDCG